jgi:hypothetical protein
MMLAILNFGGDQSATQMPHKTRQVGRLLILLRTTGQKKKETRRLSHARLSISNSFSTS